MVVVIGPGLVVVVGSGLIVVVVVAFEVVVGPFVHPELAGQSHVFTLLFQYVPL